MKTYEQARDAALAAGLPQEALNAETIRPFGFDPADPTAGLETGPKISLEQARQELVVLQQEAKASQAGPAVLAQLKRLAGFFAPVLLLLVLTGCGPTPQAQNAVAQTEISVRFSDLQKTALYMRLVDDWTQGKLAEVDRLHAAALAALPALPQDKTVAAVEALNAQKITNTKRVLDIAASMKGKWASAQQNDAVAFAYLEGLRQYFTTSAKTFNDMTDATNAVWEVIEARYKKP